MGAPPGTCRLLKRHMHGTQRAAEGWHDECSSTLVATGFAQGAPSPCVFARRKRHVVISVHGDKLHGCGAKVGILFLRGRNTQALCPRGGCATSDRVRWMTTFLNRAKRWTEQGVEYTADPRQVEKLLETLELQSEGAKEDTQGQCAAPPTPGRVGAARARAHLVLRGRRSTTWRLIGPISYSQPRKYAA